MNAVPRSGVRYNYLQKMLYITDIMVYIESMINRKPAFGALIALTPDGKVFYWNPGAEATFGYTSEEALGHSLNELIVPSDRIDEEVAIRRKALETKAVTRERRQKLAVNWRRQIPSLNTASTD
jgi:PAS domain-containing protein